MILLLASLTAVSPVQLDSARISIELETDSAAVEARYHIRGTTDSVRFVLIRQDGQELRGFNVRGASGPLDTLPGLYQLTISPSRSDTIVLILRHRVSGDVARIPMFTPSTATEPGGGGVRIAVHGLLDDVRLADGFPRLVVGSDGAALAELDNVPSFVRLPPSEGSWSTSRVADVFVLLLVVSGSVSWLARRRVLVTARPTV